VSWSSINSSRPKTATDLPVGSPSPGCGTSVHPTRRLNARAAQYGSRMRQARRTANRFVPPACHSWLAGDTAREKPDSTMKMATAT
jgi:hypothetical protein